MLEEYDSSRMTWSDDGQMNNKGMRGPMFERSLLCRGELGEVEGRNVHMIQLLAHPHKKSLGSEYPTLGLVTIFVQI